MPGYVTMSERSRTRVLRVEGHRATPVTSLEDPRAGDDVRQLLDNIGGSLPYVVEKLIADAGLPVPDPEFYDQQTPSGGLDVSAWMAAEVDVAPFDATRRALNDLGHLLDEAMSGCSDVVRRAVRGELATVLAPYEGVQVFARAYDRKHWDADHLVLITGALNVATPQQLVHLVSTGDAAWCLDVLEDRGDFVVPPAVLDVAEQGYLRVVAHPVQLAAWLAAHAPHLVAPAQG